MLEWMLDTLDKAGTATFKWLDTFGQDHWGFIVAFVFFWWILDRLILGTRRDMFWLRQYLRKRQLQPMVGGTPYKARPNFNGAGSKVSRQTAERIGVLAITGFGSAVRTPRPNDLKNQAKSDGIKRGGYFYNE